MRETIWDFILDNRPITNTVALPSGRSVTTRNLKSIGDLLFTPRYVASFDLTDSQTLVAGVSAAFGPNETRPGNDTQIYGADLYWKWKPVNAYAGFPFVSVQAEAMLRNYESFRTLILPGGRSITRNDTLTDWGCYSQILWGFRKGWVAALRGDFVVPADDGSVTTIPIVDFDRTARWRVSPNLTWYPSEFSKIRLQYNYDDRDTIGVDHSVWLQFEFLLGAHAAHKF